MNNQRLALVVSVIAVVIIAAVLGVRFLSSEDLEGARAPDAMNVALSVVWEGNTYAMQSRHEFYAHVEDLQEQGEVGEVFYTNADGSAEKQVSDLEDLLNQPVDILIVQAINPPALSGIIDEFMEKGVTVIPVVSPLATDNYSAQMVADDRAFGSNGAQWLVDTLGGEGNIIALDGIDGLSVAEERWAGAMSVFDDHPGIRILAKVNADWDYAKGKTATENLLQAYPEIDGVWSSGGDMTRGAVEAFQEAGRELVPMMGEDNNGFLKLWKENLDTPGFDSIGMSMPTYFFADAVDLGIGIRNGTKVAGQDFETNAVLEVYTVTRDNLDEYVREDLSDSFWANTRMSEENLQKYYGES
jgi:ribose transport system substrate-binding protein